MWRVVVLMVFALWALPGAADVRSHTLSYFDRIDVRSPMKLTVVFDREHSLQVETKSGDPSRLRFALVDNALTLSRDMSKNADGSDNSDQFDVTVTLPQLARLTASEGAHVAIEGLFAATFEADVRSGAVVMAMGAAVRNASVQTKTGGFFKISGACGTIDATADTGGTVHADHFSCNHVTARADNGATTRVYATNSAKITASGGATLVLSGGVEPMVEEVTTFATFRRW